MTVFTTMIAPTDTTLTVVVLTAIEAVVADVAEDAAVATFVAISLCYSSYTWCLQPADKVGSQYAKYL